MRNTWLIIILGTALAVLTMTSFASAQGMKGMMKDKPVMGDDSGMGMGSKGMMKDKSMCMGMEMMGTMMKKTMAVVPDGSIVVMAGNKLIKYDKDLNVVKEVEIKMDMPEIRKNMMEMKSMMKDTSMMGGDMMGGGMMGRGMETKQPAEKK